jgi:hypothetical protein
VNKFDTIASARMNQKLDRKYSINALRKMDSMDAPLPHPSV